MSQVPGLWQPCAGGREEQEEKQTADLGGYAAAPTPEPIQVFAERLITGLEWKTQL